MPNTSQSDNFNTPPLQRLAELLPEVDVPNFSPGVDRGIEKGEDGKNYIIGFQFSETARQFTQIAYDDNWVSPLVDYMGLRNTPKGERYFKDVNTIAEASPYDLACLITWMVRGDRFSEGLLASKFKDGTVLAILKRIDVLHRESGGGGDGTPND